MQDGRDASSTQPSAGSLRVVTTEPTALRQRDPYAGPGLGQNTLEGGNDLSAILQQYVRMVLKRKWIIAGILLVSVVLGSIQTLMKTPIYTAVARIQIDREAMKIVEGGSTSPVEAGGADFLRTQFELLRSRAMAEKVVSALQLETDKDFFKPRELSLLEFLRGFISEPVAPQLPPASVLQGVATSIVASNLLVMPVAGSRLLDIGYKDPSPARAQRIANAYVEAYLNSNLDKRFQANAYAKTFLDDQTKQAKIRLEEAE
jgi:uncharacterized protein involved in exopolysaccharide biosynthesis